MTWYLSYIVVYFVFMFAMGFYFFTKVKTSDAYLIAGWNVGFWPIVGTIISTNCGAAVFIGWVGMGFQVGLSGFFKFALPASIFGLILIVFFAKPLRRQRLYTIADLFSERFGGSAGLLPSILSAIIYSVPTTALQMVGMSTVFQLTLGMDAMSGITLSFVLILGFTILGGLPATIITDAIQAVILIVGITILFIASLFYGGGIGQILANTPPEYLSPAGPNGIGDVLLFALSVGPFYLIWQSTWQRIFASRTEQIAQGAGIAGIVLVMIIAVLPYSIGLIAKTYVPADIRPDLVFSYVTTDLLPPALGGIVLVGLLAALMTGADSFILQGSSNLTRDIYYRLLNPRASEKSLMFMSRFTVVIISALAVLVAYKVTDIITLYQWALRLSATIMVFPFLAVMFWKRATKAGALTSMTLAGLATLSWPYLGITLNQTVFGFTVSLISLVAVSLATKHSSNEQVRAVYWDDLDSAADNHDERTLARSQSLSG
ncbi:sodium:solute symporter family protein [Salinisphaera aquimarina]|uniref:Sodium:solute symporter n=1 Tax=Salinisphaera aquimarina TaxID=2094031 RepID=A0ABV7ET39_9GAMM